jgi:hypothetical protein
MPVIYHFSKNFSKSRLPPLTLLVACLSQPTAYASNSLWDMSLEELGKIRVTSLASGTATPLDKAAAIATVITAEDIEAMGARDIDEVLETVPGLALKLGQELAVLAHSLFGSNMAALIIKWILVLHWKPKPPMALKERLSLMLKQPLIITQYFRQCLVRHLPA